ncbi:8906_t:CDS:2 [Funneliformis geosporum]|nr:8906_t:CDS:2 [Funneliformis geosporum]
MPPQKIQHRHLKNAHNAKKTFNRNFLQDTQNNVQQPIDTILNAINFLNNLKLNELFKQIYILQDTKMFVNLATEISNKGNNSVSSTVESTKAVFEFLTVETPTKWISSSTLTKWNKEVAQINLQENRPKDTSLQFYGYGIMTDEISVIKMKDMIRCNGKSVAAAVLNACHENQLNPQQCHFWLTDNTAYMSSEKENATTCFNIIASANSFRIPCGLHVAQIVLMNFENTAFGKLDSPSGLSLKEHPYNLINLVFYLHDGYNESDKDNPLNMKSELNNTKLNLQLCCLVKFGEKIFEPIYKFLTGYDPVLRVYNSDGNVVTLLPGNRAHEMPDKVMEWIAELQNAAETISEIFQEELVEGRAILSSDDINELYKSLQTGVNKSLNGFLK